jgi:hypothetical protein
VHVRFGQRKVCIIYLRYRIIDKKSPLSEHGGLFAFKGKNMIILDTKHVNQLKDAAKDDNLACGIVLGYRENDKYIVIELHGMINEISEKKEKRFLISPLQYQQAEAFAEKKQLQVLGFWYSSGNTKHGEPEIKHAFQGIIYISAGGDEIKAWKLSGDRKHIIYYNTEVQPEVYNLSSHLAIAV